MLDLRGLVFLSPAALATLIAVVSDAIHREVILDGSVYIPPANRLVARYLDRMDFTTLLTGGDMDDTLRRRTPAGFRPIQAFRSSEELGPLAESLTTAATEASAIGPKDRFAVCLAIREIAHNVLDHAESPVGGFVVAQRAVKRREFEVAVADPGIGIAASLRRNARYADVTAQDALQLALKRGVTSSTENGNHGYGLAVIQRFLQDNGGVLFVRSGTASIEDGLERHTRANLIPFSGTIVSLRMRVGHPFQLSLYEEIGRSLAPGDKAPAQADTSDWRPLDAG